jgi:hypothetical protein
MWPDAQWRARVATLRMTGTASNTPAVRADDLMTYLRTGNYLGPCDKESLFYIFSLLRLAHPEPRQGTGRHYVAGS